MAKIVLGKYTPAIVLCIVFLFVYLTIWAIRYFGHNTGYIRRFPPWLSPCPDYWTHSKGRCYRTKDAANGREKCGAQTGQHNPVHGAPPKSSQMAYSAVEAPYKDYSAGVELSKFTWEDKCKWSQSCDVYWEGVSDQDCADKNAFKAWSSS